MDNLNKVFQAIKKNCKSVGYLDETACFKSISHELNMPNERIEFYLKELCEIGLVEYSKIKKTISLTTLGKKREKVFL